MKEANVYFIASQTNGQFYRVNRMNELKMSVFIFVVSMTLTSLVAVWKQEAKINTRNDKKIVIIQVERKVLFFASFNRTISKWPLVDGFGKLVLANKIVFETMKLSICHFEWIIVCLDGERWTTSENVASQNVSLKMHNVKWNWS